MRAFGNKLKHVKVKLDEFVHEWPQYIVELALKNWNCDLREWDGFLEECAWIEGPMSFFNLINHSSIPLK